MGCGGSKPEYYEQSAQPKPGQAAPPPNGLASQQPTGKTGKQKAVKAGSNMGLLSVLAG